MPIEVQDLSGLYPAIITPMNRPGQLDFVKLDHLLEDLIAAGVSGICACGTTGQSPVLSAGELLEILQRVNGRIGGRCQLIVAIGSNSTAQALTAARAIEQELGATTFLHVTGYCNNPPQAGLSYVHTSLRWPMHCSARTATSSFIRFLHEPLATSRRTLPSRSQSIPALSALRNRPAISPK